MEIDASKDVYLFVHGRSDLVEKSTAALVAKGFAKKRSSRHLEKKLAMLETIWPCYGCPLIRIT